jgi:hypothetical protein
MSKYPSEKDRSRGETEEQRDGSQEQKKGGQGQATHEWNQEQRERHRQGEAIRRHNAKQKFVTDEDIKRRTA